MTSFLFCERFFSDSEGVQKRKAMTGILESLVISFFKARISYA